MLNALSDAWKQAQNKPLARAVMSQFTVEFTTRILIGELPDGELSRASLIETVRERLTEVRDSFAILAGSFPEGYCASLVSLAQFHAFLSESEAVESLLAIVRGLNVICRERAIAGLIQGESFADDAAINTLLQSGSIAPAEAELLRAINLIHVGDSDSARLKAEAGLALEPNGWIREALASVLFSASMSKGAMEEAPRVLDAHSGAFSPEHRAGLECSVVAVNSGPGAAARSISVAITKLGEHPALLRALAMYELAATGERDGGGHEEVGATDIASRAVNAARSLYRVLPSFESNVLLYNCAPPE